MKKFSVNVVVTISSDIEVSANDAKEAIAKAREKFFANANKNRRYGLEAPCIDYDFDCEDEVG